MPWYWTDDIADFLRTNKLVSDEVLAGLIAAPVAMRRTEATVEAAVLGMLDDEEIPLAA
ncbi:MAG: hypothetical protein R3258_09790 [Acidimicrobiia bacterium]|nr:hypothetical protein [Acidimicrobiia bacterium]